MPSSVFLRHMLQDVRESLARKCFSLGDMLLDRFAEDTRTACAAVGDEFNKITGEIGKQSSNIEELASLEVLLCTQCVLPVPSFVFALC